MAARVLTSFVRNRLINEVYLPLVGDNLAKQLGTAGADTTGADGAPPDTNTGRAAP